MHPVSIFTLFLIAAGALVMAICIRHFGPIVRQLKHVSETEYKKISKLYRFLMVLMCFFLCGYVIVFLGLVSEIKIIGELFVGAIFFFGAVFVLLVIILQSKMTTSLKQRYEVAIRTNDSLEAERKNLTELNARLTEEIHGRVEAQKAQTASKIFLQTIIDSLPEQIFVVNRDYRITLANRRTLELNGLNHLPDLIHCHQLSHGRGIPCHENTHPCPMPEILKTGKPATVEHIYEDAEGQACVVEIIAAPIFDASGGISQIVESCRDITNRRQAEDRLRESELKYRKLSEVTLEGICFNDNSVIIDVNEAFARMFGYGREELIGIDAAKTLIAPESRKRVAQVVAAQSTMVYEAVGVKKNGTCFPLEIEGRAVQYQGRAVRVTSVRDITERKQTEQRMIMMQKMQAIGTLAGGIAHDFNNILSAIMGYAQIGLLHIDPGHEQAAWLENILQASHRAKELVAQILSFSRHEEDTARPVKLAMIIKETFKLLRPSIPTTIEMIMEIDANVGPIHAEATRIHQVLMNLCTNAAHAMRNNGGTLTIGLNQTVIEDDFQTRMKAVPSGTYAHLRVADTGHGMDAQTLDRIFEPYFTTKEKGEGTGLGLFVVHGIVNQFNGWMDVASKPGQGTTVSIFFPVMQAQTEVAPKQTGMIPSGTETILLVDDDAQIVEMTSQMLATLGYRVIPADSAADALRLFSDIPNNIDLVITDQTMPEMTGEMLIGRLRELRPDLPTIICTGYSETMDMQKAREQGIDAFLMKPVDIMDVARTIRQILDAVPLAHP